MSYRAKEDKLQAMLQSLAWHMIYSAVPTSGVKTDKGTMVQKNPRDTQ